MSKHTTVYLSGYCAIPFEFTADLPPGLTRKQVRELLTEIAQEEAPMGAEDIDFDLPSHHRYEYAADSTSEGSHEQG